MSGWRSAALHPLLWLILAVGMGLVVAYSKRPWFDEAGYADVGYQLWQSGRMIMPIWPSSEIPRADHYFAMPPLHFLLQALWYRLFDIGYLQMRLLSLLVSTAGLFGLWLMVRHLTGNTVVAGLALAFAATDYLLRVVAGDGRMDAVSIGFGFLALGAYLSLRQHRPLVATVVAHSLVAASGLCHPAGLAYFVALVLLAVTHDGRRIFAPRALALAALPYLVGLAGWLYFILQDPPEFMQQFFNEVFGRVRSESSFVGFLGARVHGYLVNYGFGPTSTAISRIKAVMLVIYLSAIAICLLSPAVRRAARAQWLLGLTILFAMMGFFVFGTKTQYIAHVIPLYAATLAAVCYGAWRIAPRLRIAVAGLVVGVICLNLASTAVYSVLRNGLRDDFEPAAAAVRSVWRPGMHMIGAMEMAYVVGFAGQVRYRFDDPAAATLTPDVYVLDVESRALWDHAAGGAAVVDRHLSAYKLVHQGSWYSVYLRAPGVAGSG